MKLEKFKGFTNPITKEGMRALAIVLGALVIIAGIVYVANANLGKGKESTVLPATTRQEATVTVQPTVPTEIPTITPLTKQGGTLTASPSSTGKVQKSIGTPTSTVKGVTVTTAPTR